MKKNILVAFLFAITSQFALGLERSTITYCEVKMSFGDLSTAPCADINELSHGYEQSGCNVKVCNVSLNVNVLICIPKDSRYATNAMYIDHNNCSN